MSLGTGEEDDGSEDGLSSAREAQRSARIASAVRARGAPIGRVRGGVRGGVRGRARGGVRGRGRGRVSVACAASRAVELRSRAAAPSRAWARGRVGVGAV